MRVLINLMAVMATSFFLAACNGGSTSDAVQQLVEDNLPVSLERVEVTPTNPTTPLGVGVQFTATAVFSDSTNADVTDQVTWSSTDLGVATIDAAGMTTTISTGNTTIAAELNGVSSNDSGNSSVLTVSAAALTRIEVTPTTVSKALGYTQKFTATGVYSDMSTADITTMVSWHSNDNGIATISNNSGNEGEATTVAVGSVTISARHGGLSSDDTSTSSTFTVTDAVLTRIDLSPLTVSLAKGLTQQINATGTYSDNTTDDVTEAATWSSTDGLIASVSDIAGNKGLVTAEDVGNATISASLDGINSVDGDGDVAMTVTTEELTSIAITPDAPSIAKGLTQQMIATGTYTDSSTQDITTAVTWTSNTPATATISNASGSKGLVTSVDTGTTTISAALDGVDSGDDGNNETLTVTPAVLSSIMITPASPSINSGETEQFSATGTYSDATTADITPSVTWSSSDPDIATISNTSGTKGLATGVAEGTVSIDATHTSASINASDSGGEASLQVTPIYTSCLANLTDNPGALDGNYTIDPDGLGGVGSYNVFCDMSNGGFTLYTIDGVYDAPAAESQCATKGLQFFVPRTSAHLVSAINFATTDYLTIMGIYPKFNGAICTSTPLNSDNCTNWGPNDGGRYYVSTRTDIPEPNGDNSMIYSMLYQWSSGTLDWYNDAPVGYSSTSGILCSHPDEINITP